MTPKEDPKDKAARERERRMDPLACHLVAGTVWWPSGFGEIGKVGESGLRQPVTIMGEWLSA